MIDEIIRKAKTENRFVYIFAHIYPDGDAIGAALALREYLESNGVKAKYVVTEIISKYKGLVDKIYPVKKVKKNSIAVILDTPTKVRINGYFSVDYKLNDTLVQGQTDDKLTKEFVFDTQTNITIECQTGENEYENGNYFASIEVLPNE